MTTLSGGLPLAMDYPILDPGADLKAGENHAFWFFDDSGKYSLLNCHIQGGGSVPAGSVVTGEYQAFDSWKTRRIVFPIAGPDDELMVDFAIADGAERDGYTLGGWTFRCEKPFERWTGRYSGKPRVIERSRSMRDVIDLNGPRASIEIDLVFEMTLPPWSNGTFVEQTASTTNGVLAIGKPRYEQLCRVSGTVRRPEQPDYPFTGTGIRTHRLGERKATVILASSWTSAVFPSGKGFGSVQLLSPDGSKMYSEAFVTSPGSGMSMARIVETPYWQRLDTVGERFTIKLDGPEGLQTVEVEVLKAAYNYGIGVDRTAGAIDFCHMMCRYRWDGEETVGLMELGMAVERLKP